MSAYILALLIGFETFHYYLFFCDPLVSPVSPPMSVRSACVSQFLYKMIPVLL